MATQVAHSRHVQCTHVVLICRLCFVQMPRLIISGFQAVESNVSTVVLRRGRVTIRDL